MLTLLMRPQLLITRYIIWEWFMSCSFHYRQQSLWAQAQPRDQCLNLLQSMKAVKITKKEKPVETVNDALF